MNEAPGAAVRSWLVRRLQHAGRRGDRPRAHQRGAKIVLCEEQYVDRIRQSGAPVEHLVCIDGRPAGTLTVEDLVGLGSPDFDFDAAWRAV
jgi:hypothetical protein